MSRQQGRLFPEQERLKLLQARITQMTASQWNRFYKKGWDPSYMLVVEKDDIPTLSEVWKKDPMVGSTELFLKKIKTVVLSKGPEDQNRRVIAAGDGGWIFGLFFALLQRQVREGTMATQGRCYATITELENDEVRQVMVDNWAQELLLKRRL